MVSPSSGGRPGSIAAYPGRPGRRVADTGSHAHGNRVATLGAARRTTVSAVAPSDIHRNALLEQPVPIGYLVTVALLAWCTLFALAPPRPRHSSPSNLSYWFGFLVNELPVVGWAWLAASTLLALAQGDLDSPGAWAAVGLAAVTAAGLVAVARRGLRAGPAVGQGPDPAPPSYRRG